MNNKVPETPSIGLGIAVLAEELGGIGERAVKDFYKKHWKKFAAVAGLLQAMTACNLFPKASATEPTPIAPITQPVDPNVIPVLPPRTPDIRPIDVLSPRFGPTPFAQQPEYATEVEKQFKNYLDTSPDTLDFEKTAVFDRDASTTIVATGVGSEQDRKQIVFDWLTTRDPITNEPYYYVRFVDADRKAQFVSPSNPTKAYNFKRNADGTITWSLIIPTKGGFVPIIQETFIPNADPDKIMSVKTVFTHPVTGEQIVIETKTASNGNQQIAGGLEQILRFFDIRPKIAEAATLSPEEIVRQDVQNSFEQQQNAPITMLAVRAYANAYGLKEQDVMKELVIQPKKDSKGNIFYTADAKDGAPLFIATQDQKSREWGWREGVIPNIKPTNIRIASSGNYDYANMITNYFGSYSGGYAFHWINNEPAEGKLNSSVLLNEVRVGNSIGANYQAYHLVWGLQDFLPQWLKDKAPKITNQELLTLIKNHAVEMVRTTKGRVSLYSVVNEPLGSKLEKPHLFTKLGSTDEESAKWIGELFNVVHQEDGTAKLILNDTQIELGGAKSDKIFNIISTMRKNNVPIDSIGFQMHLNGAEFTGTNLQTNIAKLREQIRRYRAIGIEVHFTEMDVDMQDVQGDKLKIQGDIYREIIRAALEEGVTDFTFFSGKDENSWLIKNYGRVNSQPTLINNNGPKLAYYEVLKALLAAK